MISFFIWSYARSYCALLFEWSKCGESVISSLPTLLWAAGSAALAHRLITSIFRRFIFRRIPIWEILIQHLLFIWMIIYSLHFWTVLVKIVKYLIEYCYVVEDSIPSVQDIESCKIMQQWVIWMCGLTPLALYVHMRPKAVSPPIMIWITTNPWHRREMGAYGYYLSRPLVLNSTQPSHRHQALVLRRAFSDSSTLIKEPLKKRRISKSV